MASEVTAAMLADALELARRRPDSWPYRWCFPSPDSLHVAPHGAIGVPDKPGAGVGHIFNTIFSYTVPRGFIFVLAGVMHTIQSATYKEGDGSLLWSLFVDSAFAYAPPIPGVPQPLGASARGVEDMRNMMFSRGSPTAGPWPVPGRPRFEEGAVLAYQVANVSLTVVSTDVVMAALAGWLEPVGAQ